MGLLRVLLFFGGLRLPPTLELLQDPPTIYEGPAGSYFGFALDFHMSEGRPSVAVGAPRANTSQPGVAQPGAVFLCSWPPDKTPCHPLPIDTAGNESESQGALELHTYKSDQWLGASVTSWDGKLVVCAPLQHWNAIEGQQEAFSTPTGTCFVWSPGQRRTVWYSPCRDQTMASTYRQRNYGEGEPGSGGCPQLLVCLTLPCALSARQALLRDRLQRRCHAGRDAGAGCPRRVLFHGARVLGGAGQDPQALPRHLPAVAGEPRAPHGAGVWGLRGRVPGILGGCGRV